MKNIIEQIKNKFDKNKTVFIYTLKWYYLHKGLWCLYQTTTMESNIIHSFNFSSYALHKILSLKFKEGINFTRRTLTNDSSKFKNNKVRVVRTY